MSPALEDLIVFHFSGAKKSTDVYNEVTYIIPKSEVESFYSFFVELEERFEEFDIKSYGVLMPSLEDVFLQINSTNTPGIFDLRQLLDNRDEPTLEVL